MEDEKRINKIEFKRIVRVNNIKRHENKRFASYCNVINQINC